MVVQGRKGYFVGAACIPASFVQLKFTYIFNYGSGSGRCFALNHAGVSRWLFCLLVLVKFNFKPGDVSCECSFVAFVCFIHLDFIAAVQPVLYRLLLGGSGSIGNARRKNDRSRAPLGPWHNPERTE